MVAFGDTDRAPLAYTKVRVPDSASESLFYLFVTLRSLAFFSQC